MSNDTTLVLGATGKSGRRVAARLRLDGLPVRTASRSSSTRFDWSDPAGWDQALQGVTAVYVVPPTVQGPVHEFVPRAAAAGVQHLVLLSGHGADRWGETTFGLDMRSAEDAVRGSGLGWTVLRASNFDQNFDDDLYRTPLLSGELALPAGGITESFVDLEDVADVAAAVLREPARHTGRVYELTGPRAVGFDEAVELISRAAGRPIGYREISPADYAATLVAVGWPAEAARDVAEMFVLLGREPLGDPADGVEAVLGRAPRTFEDYVLRTAVTGVWQR